MPAPPCTRGERIRVDLHVHTCYSPDCLTPLEDVIHAAQRQGLGGLAVLDHNAIEGALALREMAPFPVIVGEEVLTTQGEIAGLFLEERIPPGLTPQEAVALIQEQGGLVYVPHPFDRCRSNALGEPTLSTILERVDALEVLNARVIVPADNERAQEFARMHGLLGGAGSDAHSTTEIGRAYVEMAPFAGRDSFVRSLALGRVRGGVSRPHVHLYSTWAKIRRRMED